MPVEHGVWLQLTEWSILDVRADVRDDLRLGLGEVAEVADLSVVDVEASDSVAVVSAVPVVTIFVSASTAETTGAHTYENWPVMVPVSGVVPTPPINNGGGGPSPSPATGGGGCCDGGAGDGCGATPYVDNTQTLPPWTHECVGGGTVPTASDVTNSESWDPQ